MIKIPSYQEIRQTPGGHVLGLYNLIKEVAEELNKQEKPEESNKKTRK
jgi:hypothetical protein